jgi:hypothetical protein
VRRLGRVEAPRDLLHAVVARDRSTDILAVARVDLEPLDARLRGAEVAALLVEPLAQRGEARECDLSW